MVTVLDLGLIEKFDVIFPVILVWAVIFALLQKTGALGKGDKSLGVNAAIASAVSLMVLISRTVIDLINFMLPWFTVAILFFVLIILIFRTFGLKESVLEKAVSDKAAYWALLGVSLLIMIAGLGNVFGQSVLEQRAGLDPVQVAEGGVASSDFQSNIYATLFHPKVLGLIVIFTIIVFAIALLSS